MELYSTEQLFSGSFKTQSVTKAHFQLKGNSCSNKSYETMFGQRAEKKSKYKKVYEVWAGQQ